jgi:hypothetical protein
MIIDCHSRFLEVKFWIKSNKPPFDSLKKSTFFLPRDAALFGRNQKYTQIIIGITIPRIFCFRWSFCESGIQTSGLLKEINRTLFDFLQKSTFG